jgi:hypothetical protein
VRLLLSEATDLSQSGQQQTAEVLIALRGARCYLSRLSAMTNGSRKEAAGKPSMMLKNELPRFIYLSILLPTIVFRQFYMDMKAAYGLNVFRYNSLHF